MNLNNIQDNIQNNVQDNIQPDTNQNNVQDNVQNNVQDDIQDTEYKRLCIILDDFIKSVGASPAQKSAEWYSIKAKTIGGSEVAAVIGKNKYKTCKALIAEKIGIPGTLFTGNIATRWGTVFEQLTRDWAQTVLLMKDPIQETGSIAGIIERQRYSPDGLGVVTLTSSDNQQLDYIVLFEFKSPFRSIPDGTIPAHYRPQIQTGMLTIPIVELSIFVNNCYRKCSLKDIGFNTKYDTKFHNDSKSVNLMEKVYGVGVLCFYQTKSHYELAIKKLGYGADSDSDLDSYLDEVYGDRKPDDGWQDDSRPEDSRPVDRKPVDRKQGDSRPDDSTAPHQIQETPQFNTSDATLSYDINILMNSAEEMIDFGIESNRIMERLFELIESKSIKVMYYPIIVNQEAVNTIKFINVHGKKRNVTDINVKKVIKSQLNDFLEKCDNSDNIPVGYLPWKLVKTDIISDLLLDNWKDTIEQPIKNTLHQIDSILQSDNPIDAYYKLYPKRITKPTINPLASNEIMGDLHYSSDSEVEL